MNSRAELLFDPPYRVFLKARYLSLAYSDLARDLGLGFAHVKAQRKNTLFTLVKARDRLVHTVEQAGLLVEDEVVVVGHAIRHGIGVLEQLNPTVRRT